jgi:hypothetical protein
MNSVVFGYGQLEVKHILEAIIGGAKGNLDPSLARVEEAPEAIVVPITVKGLLLQTLIQIFAYTIRSFGPGPSFVNKETEHAYFSRFSKFLNGMVM